MEEMEAGMYPKVQMNDAVAIVSCVEGEVRSVGVGSIEDTILPAK